MEISKQRKGSDEYLIEMADYVIGDLVVEKEHLFKAYNYYNGVRDKYLYENIEKNYGIGNPTSVSFTPLIRKHIDAIIGEYLTTDVRPKISCKDEKTLTSIFRDKQLEVEKKVKDFVSRFLENAIYEQLIGKLQLDLKTLDRIIDKEIKDILESVDLSFISNYEIAGLNIVLYILQSRKMDFKNKLKTLLLNLLIAGEAYYKVLPTSAGTNFKIEIEDPLNTWVDKDPKSDYLKNSYKSVVRKWMSKEEIIMKYGDQLSKEDVESIDDNIGYDYDLRHMVLITGVGARCGDYSNPGILDGIGVNPSDESMPYMKKWDLIPVYEVEWIDWDYKDKRRIGKRYSITRIGSDIYILGDEDENLVRDIDSPNEATLSVNGMYFTDGHGAPYSLMLKTASLQDDYDLALYAKNNVIALSGTKGAIVDLAHLPEILGDKMEERIMKYLAYRKSGISLIDSSQEGDVVNQVFNGFNDMVEPGALLAILIALDMIENTASSITGVFRERLGGIQLRDAVANVEAGMQQSYIITKLYYQVMDTLVAEILTDCLNIARKVYKKGLTGLIILGNRKEIFTIMPEYYSQTDYDVHLADSTEVMKEQEFMKLLAVQLSTSNQVDPEILLVITTSKSLTEMKNALHKAIQDKKIENNQLAQLQQQLEQAQDNVNKLLKQLEQTTKKLATFNERKLNIEQQDNQMRQNIDWYKVKSDADYKNRELELMEQKNKIEYAQLFDNNPNNDAVDRDKL